MMDIVLSGMKIDRCLCYLDDVIGFGKTLESSLENLIQVFERLRESNLKLKPKKCVLFKTQVSYLGHTVTKMMCMCSMQMSSQSKIGQNLKTLKTFKVF